MSSRSAPLSTSYSRIATSFDFKIARIASRSSFESVGHAAAIFAKSEQASTEDCECSCEEGSCEVALTH